MLDVRLILFLALFVAAFLPARLPWAAAAALRGSRLAVAELILILGLGALVWTAFGPYVAIICPLVVIVPVMLVRFVRRVNAEQGRMAQSRCGG